LAGNPGSMVDRASGASADAGNPRAHPVSGVIDDPNPVWPSHVVKHGLYDIASGSQLLHCFSFTM
jgi:hypothetical protein